MPKILEKRVWNHGLLEYVHNTQHPLVVDVRPHFVVIRDKFPKSQKHFLCIKRDENPMTVADLNSSHLDMLLMMKQKQESLSREHGRLLAGFHALPSMSHLHLHLISSDFDKVQNKHQYLSFTTAFLVPLDKAIEDINSFGHVQLQDVGWYERLLRQPLECHICHTVLEFKSLKPHLKQCLSPTL
ncbi:HIT-like domain-containing protein [Gorgonomyces haynaldii]|nr:HIT-like domain-containing protein [Gorgonomyces haynaldii]